MKQLSEELVKQGNNLVVVFYKQTENRGSRVTFVKLSSIMLNLIDVIKGISNLHRIINETKLTLYIIIIEWLYCA